jgi:23S rRNA (uracil1939-C5)-methyltransferase
MIKKKIVKNVEVVDVAADGRAIGKSDERVMIIPHAVPGDIVDVQTHRKRKNIIEATPINFVKYSDFRTQPFCNHFGTCGGCKWQNLDYSKQLFFKRKTVVDCLQRIGHLELPEVAQVIPATPTEFYRNKLEYTFSSHRWLSSSEISEETEITNRNALGFHVPERFDKVIDINFCYLQPNPSNDIRNAVRDFAQQEKMPFYNLRTHDGFLRTLVIRTSSIGETMVIITFKEDIPAECEKLLDFVWKQFPELTSLMYVINSKQNDTFADLPVQLYKGNPYIVETMEDLRFEIGPKSFYQTNSNQAYELYKIVRELAQFNRNEVVYDLYTGIGTIANFIARDVKKVIGIEYVSEAIKDAIHNAKINGIHNTEFFAGDMKDIFTAEFVCQHHSPDTVILDPPRAGVHPKVIDALLHVLPKKIIYVSCNPASQARDLAMVREHYKVAAVQPVDMFPHTHHIENVVKLERIIDP